MTPEQISVVQTIAFILDKIGSWPLGTLLFSVIVGPWAFAAVLFIGQRKKDVENQKAWETRFESVKRMYESNVELVKAYQKTADSMQDLIILNTQAMEGIQAVVMNNLYCPLVRKWTKQQEIDDE